MYWHRVVLLFSGLTLVVAGCDAARPGGSAGGDQPAATAEEVGYRSSGVAVVDLDEVARRLGSDAVIIQAIKESQASLNRQLQSLQTSLQEQYQQKESELKSQWAEGQQEQTAGAKQLEGFGQQLDLQLSQARRKAQGALGAHRQRLIRSFREEIKPVAQEVAAQRGLGVVITKNDNVLVAFDDAHDITDAVVEKLLSQRAASRADASSAVANRPAQPATTRR